MAAPALSSLTRLTAFSAVATLLVALGGCGSAGANHRGVAAGAERAKPEGAPAEKADAAAAVHVVQPGETLWRIASTHGTTPQALCRLNGITDVRTLRVGMTLKLPAAASSPALAAAAKPDPAERKSNHLAHDLHHYPLRWPLDGAITSRFGARDGRPHDGIDIGAPEGTAVRAAAGGQVVFAAEHAGYGNLVILRHTDGLVTIYAHASVNLVRKGQQVSTGQVIAKVGTTGRTSGPHLHFEVRKGLTPENPLHFLPP
jgi:murein DD-endopeptidase MepM/ murein hydrolase activator NlpD